MGTWGRIFISYRRDDAPGDARNLYKELARTFGTANVFMDVDKLLAGQRFDRELDKALSQCNALLAVIGPRWMELLSDRAGSGERDFVHDEIAAALKRDIVVIPVLIGREERMPSLPRPDNLPDDIRALVLHQKKSIAHESFDRDAAELIGELKTVLRGEPRVVPWRAIGISGGTGLFLMAALLAYGTGTFWPNPSKPPPSQGMDGGTRIAQDRAAAEDADRKKAVDEASKRAAADAAAKNAADESARKKAADEEAAKKAAQEAARQAEADAAKKKAMDEAARKQTLEQETNKKAAEDAKRQMEADVARKKAEDAAASARAAAEETNRIEAARRQAEAARKKAAEDAGRKVEADAKAAEVAAKKKAAGAEAARKQPDEQGRLAAAACDRLAASQNDDFRPKGVAGVDITRINAAAAARACDEAMRQYPDEARFAYQASRAAFARGNYKQAVALLLTAVDKGKLAALVDLGVLYETGVGVDKDPDRARTLYKQAADRGDTRGAEKLENLR